MIEIFEENEAEKKNEEDIGDIFGEKRQTEEYPGENEIAERSALLKYEIGEERKRSEYPKERVGIDDLGYPDQDGGKCDKDEAEKSVSSSQQALQKKVKQWQHKRDEKKLRETEGEVVALHIVFEVEDLALIMCGTVLFG